jgi:hypothetical protein
MMCRTRLICRFPARDSRCRIWSPEDASMGAVPFQEAKCALLGNRVMSPTSTSRRAAPEGPMPCRSISVVPVEATSSLSCLSASLERRWIRSRSLISSAATRRRVLPVASRGRTLASMALAWAADRLFFAPPGMSSSSSGQLGDHAGVVLTKGPAAVDQDPQDRELLVVDHRSKTRHPGADQSNRVRVGGAGLTTLPGGEHACPCGQLRWDVEDLFTIGEEPVGDVPADAVAAFDGPYPVRPLPGVAQHRVVAVAVGAVAAAAEDGLIGGHHLDRGRAFVWVHAKDHSVHASPPMLDPSPGHRAGRATLLRAEQTPLEPLPALGRRPEPRRPKVSHTTSVGSRCENDGPGAWTEPGRAPVLRQ